MSSKKSDNHSGNYIGNQVVSGGTVINVGRDYNVTDNRSGVTLQEFQSLLSQINSQLRTGGLPRSEREYIEATVAQVLEQSRKKEPSKNLIVTQLSAAFELVKQASGAAAAAVTIAELLQKAISFAQGLF